MRLEPLAPTQDMDDVQRRLHHEMAPVIEEHLTGFVSTRADGALVGPFAAMLRFPQFGESAWAFTRALIDHTALPKPAHEVAILVVGAAHDSRYELYAHEHVGLQAGLTAAKVATISAGQRPADLDEAEAAAYDVAAALVAGRQLPATTYRRALEVFGEEQVAELVYLVGGYCLVSVLLNAFDVPVPGRD